MWEAIEAGYLPGILALPDAGEDPKISTSSQRRRQATKYLSIWLAGVEFQGLQVAPAKRCPSLILTTNVRCLAPPTTKAQWIQLACDYGQVEVLKLFLKLSVHGYENAILRRRAITTACHRGSLDIVQCLLEHGYSQYVSTEDYFDAQAQGYEAIAGL
ncbi:hypothetical protein VM1G_12037 [Cytospora mali]|uniref:Uncharacterized protein n=1 Tax=Cytospora mali TaxID=578113 RepID=A0A194VJ25_CYTMA|nr:hypothetical protein VM1G_12037 [Valsa mali]